MLIGFALFKSRTFRSHLPPGLSRGYSDSASTMLDGGNEGGGYIDQERNESTAHLVSSGAPYGGYPVRRPLHLCSALFVSSVLHLFSAMIHY